MGNPVDIPQQRMSIIEDILPVQDIRARLLEALAGLDQLTIDLSGVSELDSAGLDFDVALASRQTRQTTCAGVIIPAESTYLMALAMLTSAG